jgi:hypothetical protein
MNQNCRVIALSFVVLLLLISSQNSNAQFVYSPFVLGIKENPEARISGQPINLRVQFASLCFNGITGAETSVTQIVNTSGLVTIKVVGYCPPPFVAIFTYRYLDVGYLPPGAYDVRYELYNFDGSFVGEGRAPSSEGELPFTVLAPTQENLNRIFRVPTMSADRLIWLSVLLAIAVFVHSRLRKS